QESAGGVAIKERLPVLIATVDEDPRLGPLRSAVQQEGIQTALFLPFVYHDEVLGLLALYHRESYRYSSEEMELLAIFVSLATTAIKNAQFYTSISQSRSNLSAILQSMTDGVVALDNQERVIFINQPLFDLLGLEPSDPDRWVGWSMEELWPELRELAALLDEGEPMPRDTVRVAVELRNPPRALEIVRAPILDERENRMGYLLLLHDITELRANERMKDELLSVLSHELRTPLTSILGYSKLLVDRPDSPSSKRTRWASHILDKSRLLNRLINEVLDLSRLNVQRLDLRIEPNDLETIIRRIVNEQRVTTDKHVLGVEVEGDLHRVPFDEDRIDQLLTNLIINAIKYSPDGGAITIRAKRDGDWVQIDVEDEGMGIPQEYHERIFEPFFRVDNSTTRAVYGTGLGLPLCLGIAKAHGGNLTLTSEVGRGSIFHVRLPC
ncbi:MAG: ATP-binding protein, partial [Chloroflexota bacterium]|nr:ATP-binding protein [Chloroflexota bacterium]